MRLVVVAVAVVSMCVRWHHWCPCLVKQDTLVKALDVNFVIESKILHPEWQKRAMRSELMLLVTLTLPQWGPAFGRWNHPKWSLSVTCDWCSWFPPEKIVEAVAVSCFHFSLGEASYVLCLWEADKWLFPCAELVHQADHTASESIISLTTLTLIVINLTIKKFHHQTALQASIVQSLTLNKPLACTTFGVLRSLPCSQLLPLM